MKILHLEDRDDKAEVIGSRLEGHDVTRSVCWKDYQRELHETLDWDLLILDIQVPMFAGDFPKDMGRASLSEARRAGYTGPIIFISGNPAGLMLDHDPDASAYWAHDVSGWRDAVEQVAQRLEDE